MFFIRSTIIFFYLFIGKSIRMCSPEVILYEIVTQLENSYKSCIFLEII